MAHVKQMPLLDDPRLFGLDSNANITCQLQESNELMETLLVLGGGGGGKWLSLAVAWGGQLVDKVWTICGQLVYGGQTHRG